MVNRDHLGHTHIKRLCFVYSVGGLLFSPMCISKLFPGSLPSLNHFYPELTAAPQEPADALKML